MATDKSKQAINRTGMTGLSDRPELLTLPPEIRTMICKYMDVSSLRNVRLTCKMLKSTVESPEVLENFPVTISSSRQLRQLLQSDVPFNNVILNFKTLEEQLYLQDFGEKYGACIRKVQINTFIFSQRGHYKAIELLSKCTRLKELEIMTVDSVLYQDSSLFGVLLNNLSALKKLTVHKIRGRHNGEEDVNFFLKVLNNCKNLGSITIPRIDSYVEMIEMRKTIINQAQENHNNDDNDGEENREADENWERGENWDENWEIENNLFPSWRMDHFVYPAQVGTNIEGILVHPVLDYIRLKTTKEKNSPKVKQINIQNLPDVEGTVFQELLQFCYENQINLVGLGRAQIPWSMQCNQSKLTWDPKYAEVVKSAENLICLPNVVPPVIFQNLTTLSMSSISFMGFDREDFTYNSNLSLPHLQNLHLEFFCEMPGSKTQHFINKLLRDYKRPTVQKLEINWLEPPCHKLNGIDLAKNFKNLRELKIDGWNAFNSEFRLIWETLLNLEKVSVLNCKNLTNEGFVGNFDLKDSRNIHLRPFNRLQELKSLTIRDARGKIDEVALLGSFRWMKLQYFNYSTCAKIPQDAYRALMGTPLGEHVEYCFLPKPVSNNTWCLSPRQLTKGFKNLKRPLSNWTRL